MVRGADHQNHYPNTEAMSKITFGLSSEKIARISSELSEKDFLRFQPRFWEGIAEEFGWDALTLALWYFRIEAERKFSEETPK